MSFRALPGIFADLVIVAMGLLSITDALRATGLVHPVAVVFTGGWVVALLARRRLSWSPALVPLLVVGHAVALQGWPNESVATMLVLFGSAGLFGAQVGVSRAVAAAPLWPAAIGALMLVTPYGEAGLFDLFYPATFSLVCLGGGTVVGRATSARRTAQRRAHEAERELEERRAGIIAEERTRIAQDLRALVVDEIQAIQRWAVDTRALLHHNDRAGAEQALLQIENAGRETLADLRHMLGLLRRDMTQGVLRPQPSLAALDEIVQRAALRALKVTLTVEGEPRPLPRGIEVVVYRVVERAVEQACQAAVPHAEVRIRHDPDVVGVQVLARGLAPLVHHEHLAIRERVVLYDGDMLIGTDEHDRDVLHVRLPLPTTTQGAPT